MMRFFWSYPAPNMCRRSFLFAYRQISITVLINVWRLKYLKAALVWNKCYTRDDVFLRGNARPVNNTNSVCNYNAFPVHVIQKSMKKAYYNCVVVMEILIFLTHSLLISCMCVFYRQKQNLDLSENSPNIHALSKWEWRPVFVLNEAAAQLSVWLLL